nr:homeobox protein NANOG-like [Delphinus delphis]
MGRPYREMLGWDTRERQQWLLLECDLSRWILSSQGPRGAPTCASALSRSTGYSLLLPGIHRLCSGAANPRGLDGAPNYHRATAADKSTEKKEEKVLVKKQKTRTVFSQTQLCVLNDRFQRQKYLSLQQMQELSNILNLSYKQVKTWFQNQRMKCKRWQKNNWPRNSNIVTRGPATTEYPGFYSYHQGCLVNSSGNLPMWGNQTWNNPTWSNKSWNSQSWNNQSWNSQTWCPQAWNNHTWNSQFNIYVEEFLQPQIQYQQSSPVSDLEATLETAGESYNIIQQTAKYFNSQQQIMDLFPNYPLNIQPEDL